MTSTERSMLAEMIAAVPGLGMADLHNLDIESPGGLASVFPVSELAAASIGVAALAAARLSGATKVSVDRRLASAWFAQSISPIGWALPAAWDPLSGDYRTRDGWIRLHTNAPHHRAAALSALGCDSAPASVTAGVSSWMGDELEAAIVATGGCAAVMRTAREWAASAHGAAVATEPLIAWDDLARCSDPLPTSQANRPLAGIRVLDLTRVLAGPVATRFLALLGADVLRVDPPGWDEAIIPDVTLGKRTTRLNLTDRADRATFTTLLASADVLVHGYRPGALEGLGFDRPERQRIRPGLIDISLDAYGWDGPLAGRRGFDSLVQMSTGIADAGMVDAASDRPTPLPVQALDHATGYLAAAAALSALSHRRDTGIARSARLSLARTAQLLLDRQGEGNSDREPFLPLEADDYNPTPEATSWGLAKRLHPPVHVDGVALHGTPARRLGADEPVWL